MNETLKEIGKGLIALANLLMVLLFFKHYQETDNIIDFYYGVIFGISLYFFGGVFILIGKDLEEE